MGNTQGVWILHTVIFLLNFLIVDKQTTTAKRDGKERGTEEINQPRYLKNVLTLKWK